MIENKIKVLDDKTHVLTVPSRYIGSINKSKRVEFILSNETNLYQKEEIEYVPAVLTLFKEVISNAIDENIRTSGQFANKIDITIDNEGLITVFDNGRGLPHEIEETTQLPQSVVAFTQLKSGTNFDTQTMSVGQNGEGVSLVNIFSKRFDVDTSDGTYRTILTCKNNLTENNWKTRKCKLKYTKISYLLDFERFNIDLHEITSDISIYKRLFKKTIIDYKMCYPHINFKLNDEKIKFGNFTRYISLYTTEKVEIFQYENVDIGIYSTDEFEHSSFVNGIYTRRGGYHVEFISYWIINKLREKLQKKYKEIKPADIKNKFAFIISVKNFLAPRFDSQTKEELINNNEDFETNLFLDYWEDLENIVNKLFKSQELIEPIVGYFKLKEKWKKDQLLKNKEKDLKNIKVAKLIEANSRDRENCILYIGEGKSAVGSMFIKCRDSNYQAGYSLRGKFISCQGTEKSKLIKNTEVSDICKSINLKLSDSSIDNMRYGKIVILTDQDPDGFSIKTTLINFFYTFWPDLIRNNHLYVGESPLIEAKNLETNELKYFFSINEFKLENEQYKMIKYNKGLGSLNENDYTFTLANLVQITEDDIAREMLDIAFDACNVDKRKEWMITTV